ncbi:MAG: hypothetical protein HYZ14_12990 [Bacteroidetes bacterium]|nr:hypothetical protein [Bacteroidota bacterium]
MMKQQWTGTYSYEATGIEEITETAVPFELHLEVDDEGGITGYLVDSIYFGLTEAEVPVRGFREDDFLSLVAHYPFKMYKNPNGMFVLDKEAIDHEVPFYGEISEDKMEMTGTCEETENTFSAGGYVSDKLKVGFFRLRLANS